MPAPDVAVIRSVLTSRPGASLQALGRVPPTKSQCAVHTRPAVGGGPGLSYRYPVEAHLACLVQRPLAIQRQKLLGGDKIMVKRFSQLECNGQNGPALRGF